MRNGNRIKPVIAENIVEREVLHIAPGCKVYS